MSQSGLLTEDEIRTYLAESFNFKVDRDALLKPTKEVVMEIYSKFLDATHWPWRKPLRDLDELQEPSLQCLIVAGVRRMIRLYNTPTFMMTDIISPNRKRTISFLNVLIYIKAQYDNLARQMEEWKGNWEQNQDTINQINKAISEDKLEIKDLKLRMSQNKSIEELNDQYNELRRIFEAVEAECEEISKNTSKVKENIKVSAQEVDAKAAKGRQLDERILRLEEKLKLLENDRDIRKKIIETKQTISTKSQLYNNQKEQMASKNASIKEFDRFFMKEETIKRGNSIVTMLNKHEEERKTIDRRLEIAKELDLKLQSDERILQDEITALNQIKSKKKLQNKIKLEHIRKDLESRRAQIDEQAMKNTISEEEILLEIDKINRKRDQLDAKHKALEADYQLLLDKVNKPLQEVEKLDAEIMVLKKKGIVNLNTKREQVENFIGCPKEVTQVINMTYTKDRTYIKDSHR